jgi:hypothetical protein
MMKIQFSSLFDVEIAHNYFQSGRIQHLDIIPTDTCQGQLRNYGLLFKRTAKGFTVLYEVSEDDSQNSHPLKPISEDVRFSFFLQSKNPHLATFSDLPLQAQSNQLYYLHNMNNNPQNGTLLLSSKTSSAFLSSDDSLEFEALIFTYQATSSNSSANIKINDEWSNTVVNETVAIIEGKLYFEVDLRGPGPGKFSLLIDDVEKKTFYASDELVGMLVFRRTTNLQIRITIMMFWPRRLQPKSIIAKLSGNIMWS